MKMGLQNQILQNIVENAKTNNKINAKMKFINIDMLKNEKDDIKINEDDVITIQVTNSNNINTSQKIEDQILQNNKKQQREDVEAKAGCWNRQLFILNPDSEITNTIKQTFEAHGCEVQVGGLERELAYLYVFLDRKVSIKRLRRLMERGKKFGLEFFLTKTGLTSSLLARNLGKIFHLP